MPELMISIPLAKLKPSPTNPRKHLGNPAKIAEMAASMKEHGVLEPVIARQAKRGEGYELVCGHRRLEAARLAELEGIPAIVRVLTDDQVLDIQIIENSHREDVHPLDEAEAFAQAVDRGRSVQHIADAIGRPPSFIALRMQLLKLGKPGREALDAGKITLAIAQMVARIPDPERQRECIDDILTDSYDGPVTADEARKLIEDRYMLRLADAAFDITDAKLVQKAGACGACPKRTGAQAQLFADVKNADLCTDPACFKSKKDALFAIRLKDAKDGGQEVLEGKAAEKALYRGGGYRQLTDREWIGNKSKTVRELVGKNKPPITLAKDRHGEIHELVREADVKKCLPKLRTTKPDASMVKYEQAEKQRQAKDKRRKKAAQLAIAAAVTKAGKLAPGDLLELLVRAFAARAWNEVQKAILDRRGVETKGGDIEKKLLKLIKDSPTNADVQGFAMELALGAGQLGYGGANEVWKDGMQLAGLEFSDFEKLVAAQERAKKKPAPAGAAKAAKTKKGTPGVCRGCGCTDTTPCCDDEGNACSWAEPDLCSACAGPKPKKRTKRKAKR